MVEINITENLNNIELYLYKILNYNNIYLAGLNLGGFILLCLILLSLAQILDTEEDFKAREAEKIQRLQRFVDLTYTHVDDYTFIWDRRDPTGSNMQRLFGGQSGNFMLHPHNGSWGFRRENRNEMTLRAFPSRVRELQANGGDVLSNGVYARRELTLAAQPKFIFYISNHRDLNP